MTDGLNMTRRNLLNHALVLAGGAAVATFSPDALARAARRPARFLGRSAFATLEAFADTMVPVTDTPGALAANVPATIDAMLRHWASPATRDLVTGALGRIDAAATAQQGKPFVALSPAERLALLTEHDKAALKAVPPPPGARSANPFSPLISVADNGYHKLRELTVTLYYASEIGLTQELIYEHVPGEWQPSITITPGMRPYASGGFI